MSLFFRVVLHIRSSQTGKFARILGSRNSKALFRNIMSDVKKACLTKKIGTHNGTFHCDEVLACYMLKQLPQYKHSDIVRTRDQQLLNQCDIVVDVGGVYDASIHRYDHHQRTFNESMKTLTKSSKSWTIKLSSAGLVYLHFGRQVLSQVLEMSEDDPTLENIYDKLYDNFIQEVDAIDNGVNQSDDPPRYVITTNLSSRVGNLNPKWNDKTMDIEAQFKKAIALVGQEFMEKVLYYKHSWIPARHIVKQAILNRYEVDATGEIVELGECGCPWKDHLFDLEQEMEITDPIKFVIYKDNNGKWRVQCVSVRSQSFENRLSLLEEWRGLRDEALSQLSGIPGCVFVHATGFIGGNETREGVLEMARRTLQHGKQTQTS